MESVESKLRMKAIFVPTLDSEVQMQVGRVLRSRYGFSFVRAANPFVYSEKGRQIVESVFDLFWITNPCRTRISPPRERFLA